MASGAVSTGPLPVSHPGYERDRRQSTRRAEVSFRQAPRASATGSHAAVRTPRHRGQRGVGPAEGGEMDVSGLFGPGDPADVALVPDPTGQRPGIKACRPTADAAAPRPWRRTPRRAAAANVWAMSDSPDATATSTTPATSSHPVNAGRTPARATATPNATPAATSTTPRTVIHGASRAAAHSRRRGGSSTPWRKRGVAVPQPQDRGVARPQPVPQAGRVLAGRDRAFAGARGREPPVRRRFARAGRSDRGDTLTDTRMPPR